MYRREGSYAPSTITNRFGSWSQVAKAFANFAKDKGMGRRYSDCFRSTGKEVPGAANEKWSVAELAKPRERQMEE